MTSFPLLQEIAIIIILGVAVSALLCRLRLPNVAGLLAAGALLGPHGLGLVDDIRSIERLAEIGVVLLMFTIGLEFSIARLRHIFKRVALGGLVQVLVTFAAAAAVSMMVGQSLAQGVFFGFVVAMSSTAIVLRALADRGELDSPHGRFIVGTLIFQDLCVVPMVMLVPVLGAGGDAGRTALDIAMAMGKAALVVGVVLVSSRYLVPGLLRRLTAGGSREVFLLSILAICVGTAWLTSKVGLSLALGAFLGGLMVADSGFELRAMESMIPLRDTFMSVFFVSLGMLFDSYLLGSHPVIIALLFIGFILVKAIIAILAAMVMQFPPRAAWLAGIGLAQFGEFGFVLLQLGQSAGLTDVGTAGMLLTAGILSMFATPLLIRLAPHVSAGEKILAPLTRLFGVRGVEQIEKGALLSRHVVIIGYGTAGYLVARALRASEIPYCVLDINAENVRRGQSEGVPVFYADATSEETLDHANASGARIAVVLINDSRAEARVTDTLRRVAPELPIVVRTRFKAGRENLMHAGATEVVVEEVEASVEVMSRLLRRLEVPRNVIAEHVRATREEMQTSLRRFTLPRAAFAEHEALSEWKIDSMQISADSHGLGRSPLDMDVRRVTGALIVAVRRGSFILENPDPSQPFEDGDVVYLVGSSVSIRNAVSLMDAGIVPSSPPA